jgi:hypothetical protein
VTYDIIDDKAIFEGDIVIKLVAEISESAITVTEDNRRPNGLIPYEIDPALPNLHLVYDAIRHVKKSNLIPQA